MADRFPLLGGGSIPWSVAEEAYPDYARRYGTSQSLETLAKRGGFGPDELDQHLPGWREKASEVSVLRAQVEKLQAFKAYVHKRLDDAGIPVDPPSPHRAEGCRIGGRLDLVLTRLPELRDAEVRAKAIEDAREFFAAYVQERCSNVVTGALLAGLIRGRDEEMPARLRSLSAKEGA
jgi:hypothetical protein